MIIISIFGAKRSLRRALTLVAFSLMLGGAAFAQAGPDGSIPVAPGPDYNPNGNQMASGGPWGGGGEGGGGRRHRMGQGQGFGQGGGGDKEARRAARQQKMLKKFDANGDGQLDQNEKAQAQQFMQQRRAQRQAQGGGWNNGMNPMGPGQGMGQGMGGRRRGGIRGGHRRWQQQGQSMPGGQGGQGMQGIPPGQEHGLGQMPQQGYPNAPNNEGIPPNPNGLGQIQPFQNIPQQQ